jgi:arylsulfatase A-like enzyme
MQKRLQYCIFGLFSCIALNARQPEKPNIILVFPDQMRADAMGCMGNPDVKTPNLDKLAKEGVLLRQTFSNTPVSCPARAVILTGRYAHANGMVANDLRLKSSEITIAELLKMAGYTTGFIGKWHLDGGPKDPGFIPAERRQGFYYWAANECNHKHFKSTYFRNDSIPIPINKFEPEIWTDEAISFLDSASGKPFFLTIAMGPPHDPYKAPEEYRQLYDTAKISMRPNWVPGIKNGSKKDIAEYYGMITAIDTEFGRLMKELDKRKLRENTLILFFSDHGDMLGSHGSVFKRQPWEESVKVPGIISWPGKIPAGKNCDALFSTVDILPTLLDFCSLPIPASVQGQSLKPSIAGNSSGPEAVYFSIYGPCKWQGVESGWRGIRTKQFKYARYENKAWVLYDLVQDPYELNNLAGRSEYKNLEKRLEKLLTRYMDKSADSWKQNWTYPFADNFELTKEAFESIDAFFKAKSGNAVSK